MSIVLVPPPPAPPLPAPLPLEASKNKSIELELDEGSVRGHLRVGHFLVVVARHSLVQDLNLQPADVKLDVVRVAVLP